MAPARSRSHTRSRHSDSRRFLKRWRWRAARSGKPKRSAASIERVPDSPLMPQVSELEPQASMVEEILRAGGTVKMRVFGQSMLPSIWPGDVIVVDGAVREQITTGDIAVCHRHNRFFAHRVRKMVETASFRQFLTRGDSVIDDDPPFHAEEILGRVIQIWRGGRPWVPVRRPWVRGLGSILARCSQLRNLALRIREKTTRLGDRGMIGGDLLRELDRRQLSIRGHGV